MSDNKTSFFDHNFSGKPWFGKAEADEEYSFEVKVDSLKLVESDTPWTDEYGLTTEAIGNFRNILTEDGDEFEEEGEHVVPF